MSDDPFKEDLAAFVRVVQTAVEELIDEAHSGNIERRHHLESAVSSFEDIGILLKAERIVLDLFPADEDGPPDG